MLRLYNTLSRKKEEFVPLNEGKVGMYVCGPTVNGIPHLGHAMSQVSFDLIRRYLIFSGFDVKFVSNITDIDDKIIAGANKAGLSIGEFSEKNEAGHKNEYAKLNVMSPDVQPKATEYVSEMIELIKKLEEKGFSYLIEDDGVYFDTAKFEGYGKLSGQNLEMLEIGKRKKLTDEKRNDGDFVLWKLAKEGEPFWESPWGKGRPGWHIECTAMSLKHLAESFDIHGGGADLIFPHHENEMAQSEAYTGKPFVRYWMHNGFITIDKEKMSKSLGNFFTIKEVLERYDPEVVRFFILSTHYRSPIEFSDEQLKEAEVSIDRYYTTLTRISDFLNSVGAGEKTSAVEKTFEEMVRAFREKFLTAMDDDFNTALAVGHIFELIREVNKYLDGKPSGQKAKELVLKTMELLKEAGSVLNTFRKTPDEWQTALMKTKKIPLTEKDILNRITSREEARQKKDWAAADAIRKELDEKGIILEDKKEGTGWKIKAG